MTTTALRTPPSGPASKLSSGTSDPQNSRFLKTLNGAAFLKPPSSRTLPAILPAGFDAEGSWAKREFSSGEPRAIASANRPTISADLLLVSVATRKSQDYLEDWSSNRPLGGFSNRRFFGTPPGLSEPKASRARASAIHFLNWTTSDESAGNRRAKASQAWMAPASSPLARRALPLSHRAWA